MSMSWQWRMSTRRLKCRRKSAPRMTCLTSATMNTQRKLQHRPRLSVRERLPKVVMFELLTAWSVMPVSEGGQCGLGGGITLTFAPMSTRNCRRLVRSVTKQATWLCWTSGVGRHQRLAEAFPNQEQGGVHFRA